MKAQYQIPEWARRVARAAYPEYRGRRIRLEIAAKVDTSYNANWDGGSRTEYRFVRADGKMMHDPNGLLAPWARKYDESEVATLVPGLAVVTHTIFCGHDVGLTVHVAETPEAKQIESTVAVAQ